MNEERKAKARESLLAMVREEREKDSDFWDSLIGEAVLELATMGVVQKRVAALATIGHQQVREVKDA